MQTCISSNSSKTSSLVIAKQSKPLTCTAYFPIMPSNHPHLLLLPVVVPNSPPLSHSWSFILPCNSVGNGPSPTLVV